LANSRLPLFQRALYSLTEGAKAHIRRLVKARELTPIVVRPSLSAARLVAILVVRNEADRFEFLLDYYRKRGVEHFIVIDNLSTDGLQQLLRDQDDVSAYVANGQYGRARYGNDWINALLTRHAVGKWVLYVDADEFMVFESDRDADIAELCASLQARGASSLQAVMVDMYSDSPARDNIVRPGEDPLSVCSLYDTRGYIHRYESRSGVRWIKGGVRGRVFFPDEPWRGPALNKTPLVRWKAHQAFLKSAHEVWPRRLNGEDRRPQAALLHFKFTATAAAKVSDAGNAGQHTDEYTAYGGVETRTFGSEVTRRYEGPATLVYSGIIDPIVITG
jgi:glycosyltransferase involved in cell wall biosynthesis